MAKTASIHPGRWGRSLSWSWSQQVPPVALDIEKDGHASVLLIPWRGDEAYASRHHAGISGLEVIYAQEQSHPAGELAPHRLKLLLAVGARQQDARLAAFGTNHHP